MENTGYVCRVLAFVLCLYAVTTSPTSHRTAITSRRHNRAYGAGLNPLLHYALMRIHPPILYLHMSA
jgi:cytochrome c biogenesis factor